MSQYLRVKRDKNTYFLYAEQNETISDLKTKLSIIVGKESEDINLYNENDLLLQDNKTCQELHLENDAVVSMVYREGF